MLSFFKTTNLPSDERIQELHVTLVDFDGTLDKTEGEKKILNDDVTAIIENNNQKYKKNHLCYIFSSMWSETTNEEISKAVEAKRQNQSILHITRRQAQKLLKKKLKVQEVLIITSADPFNCSSLGSTYKNSHTPLLMSTSGSNNYDPANDPANLHLVVKDLYSQQLEQFMLTLMYNKENLKSDLETIQGQFLFRLQSSRIIGSKQQYKEFLDKIPNLPWEKLADIINDHQIMDPQSKITLIKNIKLLRDLTLANLENKTVLIAGLQNHLESTAHPSLKLFKEIKNVRLDFVPDKFFMFYHSLCKLGDSVSPGGKLVIHYLEDKPVCLKSAKAACELYYNNTGKKITIELERLHVETSKELEIKISHYQEDTKNSKTCVFEAVPASLNPTATGGNG